MVSSLSWIMKSRLEGFKVPFKIQDNSGTIRDASAPSATCAGSLPPSRGSQDLTRGRGELGELVNCDFESNSVGQRPTRARVTLHTV